MGELNCKICKSDAEVIAHYEFDSGRGYMYSVKCGCCGLATVKCHTSEEAIRCWELSTHLELTDYKNIAHAMKTKKCFWCKKRKDIEGMYFIMKPYDWSHQLRHDYPKEIWICGDCNLKYEIT